MRHPQRTLVVAALLTAATLSTGCSEKTKNAVSTDNFVVSVPTFSADSAYHYVAAQCAFGPRIPGSDAHSACGDWLAGELRRRGAVVVEQRAELKRWDGSVPARNIIGQFAPEKRRRVLLCSHWDSRPWADNDSREENRYTPIDGANDGASGVGVLLEIARHLQQQQTEVGIDILFFDAEDGGVHQDVGASVADTWCLGSQYWARHPHADGYMARYGILLDMVGGKDARFCQEQMSVRYAKSIVDKVWSTAHAIGFGTYFPYRPGSYVTDDHLPINEGQRIPCIDIIPYDEIDGFGPTWHTVDDNIAHIDPATLRAVGQTVMQVIYTER